MLANLLGRAASLRGLSQKKFTSTLANTRPTSWSTLRRQFCNFGGTGKKLFNPQRTLTFDKSGLLLISKVQMKHFYLFCVVSGSILLALDLFSLRKLLKFRERGFFGFILYGSIVIISTALLVACHNSLKEVITKVWLKSCGTKVLIRRGPFYNRPEEFSIKDISRPEKYPVDFTHSQFAQVGYPVALAGEDFVIPRTTDKLHQDIFGAIFNGMDIDVKSGNRDDSNDIVIE
jgi:hypothetical protein